MKSLKERTEIQQAYLDGAEIEMNSRDSERWINYDGSHDFDWFNWNHRVKPKQMVIWVNIYANTKPCAHTTKEEALKLASVGMNTRRKAVKFIEVIE